MKRKMHGWSVRFLVCSRRNKNLKYKAIDLFCTRWWRGGDVFIIIAVFCGVLQYFWALSYGTKLKTMYYQSTIQYCKKTMRQRGIDDAVSTVIIILPAALPDFKSSTKRNESSLKDTANFLIENQLRLKPKMNT